MMLLIKYRLSLWEWQRQKSQRLFSCTEYIGLASKLATIYSVHETATQFFASPPSTNPVLDSRMLHLDTRLAQTFYETFLGKQINNDQW